MLHYPSLASRFDGKGLADGNGIRATALLHEVFIPVNQLSISKRKKKPFKTSWMKFLFHKSVHISCCSLAAELESLGVRVTTPLCQRPHPRWDKSPPAQAFGIHFPIQEQPHPLCRRMGRGREGQRINTLPWDHNKGVRHDHLIASLGCPSRWT